MEEQTSLQDIQNTFNSYGISLEELPDIRITSIDTSSRYKLTWNPVDQLELDIAGATAQADEGDRAAAMLITSDTFESEYGYARARGEAAFYLLEMFTLYPMLVWIKILRQEIDPLLLIRSDLLLYYLSEIYPGQVLVERQELREPESQLFDNSLAARYMHTGRLVYLPGEEPAQQHMQISKYLSGVTGHLPRYSDVGEMLDETRDGATLPKLLFYGRPSESLRLAAETLNPTWRRTVLFPSQIIERVRQLSGAAEKVDVLLNQVPEWFTLQDLTLILSSLPRALQKQLENAVLDSILDAEKIMFSALLWLAALKSDLSRINRPIPVEYAGFRLTPHHEEKEIKQIVPLLIVLENLYSEHDGELDWNIEYHLINLLGVLAHDWRALIVESYMEQADFVLAVFHKEIAIENDMDFYFQIWIHTAEDDIPEGEYMALHDYEPLRPWRGPLQLRYTESGKILDFLFYYEPQLSDLQRRALIYNHIYRLDDHESDHYEEILELAKKYRYFRLLVEIVSVRSSLEKKMLDLIDWGVDLNDRSLWHERSKYLSEEYEAAKK